jgi:hypothetical protein
MNKCAYCKAPIGETSFVVVNGAKYCSWQCSQLRWQRNRFNLQKFREEQGGEYDMEHKGGTRSRH